MGILFGIIGIIILFLIAYLASENRKAINYRTVFGALLIQVFFALLVLYIPWGKAVLQATANGVSSIIDVGKSGINFVFGPLADGSVGFIFLINVLMLIVFFSSFISVLYYLKIMPLIINSIGWVIHKLLKTSKTESLSAAANIFVGQTEAPLVVRPFIPYMTKSEIFAVMVGGLASVAGSVLIGYASLGIDLRYLIAASFMAAPGGLLMAKIIVPQTDVPHDSISDLKKSERKDAESIHKHVNVIDAAASGAAAGITLVINVAAMLIAFIGLISVLDYILSGIGGLFNLKDLSLELILGYVFSPITFLIGVPWNEAVTAGRFIGEKIVLNEFVAYVHLADIIHTLSPKTQIILTFALCGFANLSSVAILIGGLGTMSPQHKPLIAQYAVKAVLAGTLSNLMSAALAGIFTFL